MAEQIDTSDERAIMKYYTDCDDIESSNHMNAMFTILCKYVSEYDKIIDSYNDLCHMVNDGKYTKLDMIKTAQLLKPFSRLNSVLACIDLVDDNIKNSKTIKDLNKQITEMRQLIKNKYKYD